MMFVLLLLLSLAFSASAQVTDGGTLGRAGVHDLSQIGVNSVGWNPALLAIEKPYKWSVELPVGFVAGAANNAFSVNFWNSNIGGDHNYSDDQVRKIIDRIPSNGLRLATQVGTPHVGASYERFALDIGGEAAGYVSVPKHVAVLALIGNQLNENYTPSDIVGDGYAAINYAVGFGYKIDQDQWKDLCVGAGFHFYQGLAMARITQVSGNLKIDTSAITGSLITHEVESNRGDGVSFDVTGAARITDQWEIGLAFRQIGAQMNWELSKSRDNYFNTDSTGLIIDSLANQGYADRAFHHYSYSYGNGIYSTTLPLIIQANGLFRLNSKWCFLGETLVRTKISSQGPAGLEAGASAEYSPLEWGVCRAGVSFGGPWRSRFGLGAGVKTSHYALDLGWNWDGGIFNSAHGVGIGLSQRIMF
jgi:hypothetical protein